MAKRIAIYTILVGNNYDNLSDPKVIDENVDYLCFVNKESELLEKNETIWNIVPIEYKNKDNGRTSRYPKIQPHKTCLADYEYSLYIDANVIIKDRFVYDRINELIKSDCKLAMLKHPFRDCVYQEAYVCIAGRRGGWIDILRQISFLKRKHYPKHNGLYEANLIFRKHNDSDVVMLDELWWKTFMRYSKRDQLSFVYALKETGVGVEYFLEPQYSTRNHFAFEYVLHKNQKINKGDRIKIGIVKSLYGISKKLLKE